jgi:hypothetical protein
VLVAAKRWQHGRRSPLRRGVNAIVAAAFSAAVPPALLDRRLPVFTLT